MVVMMLSEVPACERSLRPERAVTSSSGLEACAARRNSNPENKKKTVKRPAKRCPRPQRIAIQALGMEKNQTTTGPSYQSSPKD